MIRIKPIDDNGDVVDALFQWDKGIVLTMEHEYITQAYNVHFANARSTSAYVVESTYSDGAVSAQIPDELLREAVELLGYVYIEDDDGLGRATLYFRIRVDQRAQPADYVYSDSSEYILIEDALTEITAILEAAEDTAEDVAADAETASAAAATATAAAATATAAAETATSAAETAAADALESLGFYVGDDGYLYGTEDDE